MRRSTALCCLPSLLTVLIISLTTDLACGLQTTEPRNETASKNQYIEALNRLTLSVSSILETRLQELNKKLASSSTVTISSRSKRAILKSSPSPEELGFLYQVKPGQSLPSPSVVVDLAFVATSDRAYLIGAGQTKVDGTRGKVPCPIWQWNPRNGQFDFLARVHVISAVGVETFVLNDEPYFIFALNAREDLLDVNMRSSKLYKILPSGRIKIIQSIPTTGATSWQSLVAGEDLVLIQASYLEWRQPKNGKKRSVIPKGSSKIRIFNWAAKGGFVQVDALDAKYTTDVDVMAIQGRNFIATVNQSFADDYVESTLLIYEMKSRTTPEVAKVELFQKITGWAISDVTFIRVGTEHFLAVAYEFRVQDKQKVYEVESVIFRYNGLYFVKYQTVATSCALRWTAIYGSEGEAILHLQGTNQEQLLQFVDGSWVQIPVPLMKTVGPLTHKRMGLTGVVQQDVSSVVVAARDRVQVMQLLFAVDTQQAKSEELLQVCRGMKEKLGLQQRNRESVAVNRQVVSLSQPQALRGRKHFRRIKVKNLKLDHIQLDQPHIFKRILKDRLNTMEGLMKTLDWSSFLTKSSPQEMTGSIGVKDLSVENLVAPNVQFTDVNGVNLCMFLDQIVWFPPKVPTTVPIGRLYFAHLVLPHGMNMSGTLNNLKVPRDLVFLNRTNVFSGHKHFNQGMDIKGNLLINGTVNGIRPQDILMAGGDQIIHGDVVIQSDIDVANLDQIKDGHVSGILWSWLLDEPLRLDVGGVVTGRKEFVAPVTVRGNFQPDRLVAGVDVKRMMEKAVPLRGRKVFKHNVNFRDVSFQQHLFVKGRLNGLHIPQDVVLLSQHTWPITLNLTSTWVSTLKVDGILNGLKVDRNHIMTRTDYQTVTGHKTFYNMMAHTDIVLAGFLNAQNASTLFQEVPRTLVEVAGNYHELTVRDLRVAGPLPQALHQMLYQSVNVNEPYTFPGQVTFMDGVTFKKDLAAPQTMFAGMIPIRSPEPIHLPQTTFRDVVFEEDIVVQGQLNGYEAEPLFNNVLLTVGDQTVTAPKDFVNPIRLDANSELNGPVNDVNLAEAIRLDGRGPVPPKMEFFTPPALLGESKFQSVEVGVLNGRPVGDWLADTLLDGGGQTIQAQKHFVHGMAVGVNIEGPPTKNIEVNGIVFLDGINLAELMKDVVMVNESNEISGPTTFAADITMQDFHAHIVDGVDVNRLFAVALRRLEDRCPTFQSDVLTPNLFTPVINNVNIEEFFSNVVYVTDKVLPAQLHFSEVTVPSVHLTGMVNEVKFSEDIVRKNGQEVIVITGAKTFLLPLSMNHVQVKGTVNGIDIVRLDQTVVKQGVAQVINGDLMLTELNTRRNILVKGLVNKINLGAFLQDVMYVDEDASITGLKEFGNFFYSPEPPLQFLVGGLLDNVNLTFVADNVVTLDTFQTISGPLTFTENVHTQSLQAGNLRLGEVSKVNNVKLPEWVKTVLKTEGRFVVSGKKTFMNEVTFLNKLDTKGTINRVLTEHLLLLTGGQRVTASKNFQQVAAQDIEVHGLLMGVNVPQWAEHAVMTDKTKPAIIHGQKEFQNLVLNSDATFESTLDGVSLNNVMLTKGDQLITGEKKFAGGVSIPRWANAAVLGQLNGSPKPLPQVLEQLLVSPLPYPCKPDYVYDQGWCYKVHTYTGLSAVDPEEMCSKLQTELLTTLNDHQRNLFQRMGLHETADGWIVQGTTSNTFTCVHKAALTIKKPMKMTGSFLFNGSQATHGPQQTHLRSPVEGEFNALRDAILALDKDIVAEAMSLSKRMNDMCQAADGINNVFKNAYRPMGEFRVLQYFPPEFQKIYKLNSAITRRASFLSLESQKMGLNFWQNNTFVEVATAPLDSEVGELLEMQHESFQDETEIVLLLPTSTRLCSRLEVGNIEVLQVTIPYPDERPKLDVLRVFNLGIHCTHPSNLDIMTVSSKKLLLLGLENTLEVWNWSSEEQRFSMLWKHNERQRIRFVTTVGTKGHVLVVSGTDDGTSVLTMYTIHDNYGMLVETSIHQSGVITHLRSIESSNNMHIVMLDGSQLKLLEYDEELKWFNLKQAMESYPSATQLYWVPLPQLAWVFVSSCGHADYYEFSGYLSNHQTLDITMTDKPHLFHMHHAIFMVVKLKINGNERYVNLQSITKGPTDFKECVLPC